MRIAQVSPLFESVPPKLYGGTERVVSYLTEELVRRGHEVTLFASGDSQTSARLCSPCPAALRLDPRTIDHLAYQVLMLEQVFQLSSQFDVIHFHTDYLHFPGSRFLDFTHLTTLHGRLDLPDLIPLYREFAEMPLVSISDAQRRPLPWVNWVATVYHGLPEDLYTFYDRPGKYLAFLGRISPEKGLDQAIAMAQRSGVPLKIAAKVDRGDTEYFESRIKPLLDDPLVEFVGEIGEQDKNEFLGNALALVSPITWPEPFGLVFIEALACGTPVLTYPRGSAPELLKSGVTGYLVPNLPAAVRVIAEIPKLSRRACRRYFETHFTASLMCQAYESVYEKLSRLHTDPPVLAFRAG